MSRTIAVAIFIATIGIVSATTLFTDTFDGGIGGWIQTSTATTTATPRLGASGLAAQLQLRGMIEKQISTVGYDAITVSWNILASSLESGISNDRCHFEYSADKGHSYTSIVSLVDGQDTGSTFYSGSIVLPSNASNNNNFMIRYRASGDAGGDYCYAETTTVQGTASSFSSPPAPVMQTSYQDLTGSGIVSRSLLTYSQLTGTGQITGPVDVSAFAVPASAAQPTNYLHGSYELLNEQSVGSYAVIRDDYKYAGNAERTHLPNIFANLFSHGSHVVPQLRIVSGASHPFWEVILQGGRIWNENSDNGYSRVAIPFAITQKNSNCVHNGLLTFLFKNAANGVDIASVSRTYYQISQETCVYYKVNMWGTVDTALVTKGVFGVSGIRTAYENEVAARLPTKPLTMLATDFPGTDVSKIGSEQTTGHATFYGVEVDGTIYQSVFATRHGPYPYPEAMVAPSYSTEKTWAEVAGVLAFDLEFPAYNILNKFVRDLIPSASLSLWGDVKIRHLIDMASGNYNLAGFEADEGSTAMSNGFFLRETHSLRLNYCLTYAPRKATPGTKWIYTTCQMYLVASCMRNAVASQAPAVATWDNYLSTRIYTPLNLSSVAQTHKVTYDSMTENSGLTLYQEIGGYNKFMLLDDMAKIARFLNSQEGKINGVQKINYAQLKAALQRDTNDIGFVVTGLSFPAKYNNGVWSTDVYAGVYNTQSAPCGGEYEPYMSGYGGITIAMLKSKLNYLIVSDDSIYAMTTTLTELAQHVRAPCATTYSP